MDLTHARLFKDIASFRSVSKAASSNGISQSAASQHVQEVEAELGTSLLDRSTRPLSLTVAGQLYAELCRDIVRRHDQFIGELQTLKGKVEGTVRVASIYSVGISEMSDLEREFLRLYPDAVLEVEYLRPENVYEAVLSEQADLGLVSYPETNRQLVVLPWREEEMVVAASPYHPLGSKPDLHPYDLDGADFVAFDEGLPIRRAVDRYLRDHHVHVTVVLHFDNIQMIKEAVAHGTGVSIVPARTLETEVAQGRLLPIPIAGQDLFRPVGIIHRKRKHFQRAVQAFLDLLQQQPLRSSPAIA